MRVLVAVSIILSFMSGVPAAASELIQSSPNVSQADEAAPVQGPPEYRAWTWQASSCRTCPLRIVPVSHAETLKTPEAQAFIKSLEVHKLDLLTLYSDYGVSSQDYNLLAQMAVGILGQESLFFRSTRYAIKESIAGQLSIRVVKHLRAFLPKYQTVTSNSRGPTQIKIIPKRIESFYAFDESQLGIPENAALATMGFLIESLRTLRRLAINYHLDNVKPSTYIDYLPYLYFGWKRYLIKGTAEPERNIYVRNMKTYMSWVQLYEEVDGPNLLPRP